MGIEFEPNELRALLEKRRVLQECEVFSDTFLSPKNHISSQERGRRKTAFDTYDPVISPNSIVASFSFSAGAIFVKASRIALLWKCVTPQSACCQQK
jgi:hypothetical protein